MTAPRPGRPTLVLRLPRRRTAARWAWLVLKAAVYGFAIHQMMTRPPREAAPPGSRVPDLERMKRVRPEL